MIVSEAAGWASPSPSAKQTSSPSQSLSVASPEASMAPGCTAPSASSQSSSGAPGAAWPGPSQATGPATTVRVPQPSPSAST